MLRLVEACGSLCIEGSDLAQLGPGDLLVAAVRLGV